MAIIFNLTEVESVGLEEFLDWVEAKVDLDDPESLCSAAPMLRRLANDPDLVVSRLNEQVSLLSRHEALLSSQVLHLGGRKHFYVRANFWPSLADMTSGKVLADQFQYNVLHDHNYSFLATAHDGPGYHTDLYENAAAFEPRVGAEVDLGPVRRIHFEKGMTMFYEASRDIHTQFAPEEMSVSLNLVAVTPQVQLREQYFFSGPQGRVIDFPGGTNVSQRVSIIRLLGSIGSTNSMDLLYHLSQMHPCRRTRWAAHEALVELAPLQRVDLMERAAKDPDPQIRESAIRLLES